MFVDPRFVCVLAVLTAALGCRREGFGPPQQESEVGADQTDDQVDEETGEEPTQITLEGPNTITISDCVEYSASLRDSMQELSSASMRIIATFSVEGGAAFTDSGCQTTTSTVQFDPGIGTVQLYVQSTQAGIVQVTITPSGELVAGRRQITVEDPGLCADPSAQAATPFASGSGTTMDPFIICNAVQLDRVRDDLNAAYQLATNIDLTGTAFTPIGMPTDTNFSGSFDGGGYQISNFTYADPADDNVGLFAVVSGSVSDLSLLNVNIEGRSFTGALAGVINGSASIARIHVTGQVVAQGQWATGLVVGAAWDGTISEIVAEGSVEGINNVGGVVGVATRADIASCAATTDVFGATRVGGVVGLADGGLVLSSTWTGTVTMRIPTGWGFGGIVGSVGETSSTAVRDSDSFGSVYAPSAFFVGGVVGVVSVGSVLRSRAEGSVTGQDRVGGVAGRVAAAGGLHHVSSGADVMATGISAGGVAGHVLGGVTTSFASGNVQGNSYVGGVAGQVDWYGTIDDAYSEANVSVVVDFGGGAVGFLDHVAQVKRTYATGNVSGSGLPQGGLVGGASASSVVADSFWNSDNSVAMSAGGVGLTTVEIADSTPYSSAGWDFGRHWVMPTDVGRPAGAPLLRFADDPAYTCSSDAQTVVAQSTDFGSFVDDGTGSLQHFLGSTANGRLAGYQNDKYAGHYMMWRFPRGLPDTSDWLGSWIARRLTAPPTTWNSGQVNSLTIAIEDKSSFNLPVLDSDHIFVGGGGQVRSDVVNTQLWEEPGSGLELQGDNLAQRSPNISSMLQAHTSAHGPLSANEPLLFWLFGSTNPATVTCEDDAYLHLAWLECF